MAEPRSTPPQKLAALGRVAVSVSPSGLLFPYYLGVFRALDELEVLEGAVLAGSSGGALMGAFVCSGLSVAQAEMATKSLYSAVMQQVNRQDLLQLLRKVLQARSQPHPQCLSVDVNNPALSPQGRGTIAGAVSGGRARTVQWAPGHRRDAVPTRI